MKSVFKEKHTNRLTLTQLGCVSRHEVHCTLKVKKYGSFSVSIGHKSVTLPVGQKSHCNKISSQTHPVMSAVRARASIVSVLHVKGQDIKEIRYLGCCGYPQQLAR
jgi:hypothetical protein